MFHPGPYRTIADVEHVTAGWVDWYNNRRLHSLATAAPWSTSKPNTRPSPESRNPHDSGTEPGVVQG